MSSMLGPTAVRRTGPKVQKHNANSGPQPNPDPNLLTESVRDFSLRKAICFSCGAPLTLGWRKNTTALFTISGRIAAAVLDIVHTFVYFGTHFGSVCLSPQLSGAERNDTYRSRLVRDKLTFRSHLLYPATGLMALS